MYSLFKTDYFKLVGVFDDLEGQFYNDAWQGLGRICSHYSMS